MRNHKYISILNHITNNLKKLFGSGGVKEPSKTSSNKIRLQFTEFFNLATSLQVKSRANLFLHFSPSLKEEYEKSS
jgi:hypothetical protein